MFEETCAASGTLAIAPARCAIRGNGASAAERCPRVPLPAATRRRKLRDVLAQEKGRFGVIGSKFCIPADADHSRAEASLEFGRFRVLLRRRQLVADGVPIALGARAFELLLALLEAEGRLVSKEQLLSRIWPGIAVEEGNLKAQICALRKALGEDSDIIRSEHGRGYRFTGAARSNSGRDGFQRPMPLASWSTRRLFPQRSARRSSQGWWFDDRFGRHLNPDRDAGTAS
jgi:DNA-binding winged helix-turn-helix (wHTH) protein